MTDAYENPLAGLLSWEDAAARLQISPATLYRMVADGDIAAIKHAGKRWIEEEELIDYRVRKRNEASKTRSQRARAASRKTPAAS